MYKSRVADRHGGAHRMWPGGRFRRSALLCQPFRLACRPTRTAPLTVPAGDAICMPVAYHTTCTTGGMATATIKEKPDGSATSWADISALSFASFPIDHWRGTLVLLVLSRALQAELLFQDGAGPFECQRAGRLAAAVRPGRSRTHTSPAPPAPHTPHPHPPTHTPPPSHRGLYLITTTARTRSKRRSPRRNRHT